MNHSAGGGYRLPATYSRAAQAWRRFRVRVVYAFRHGRLPNLNRPRLFTEWVQRRKLDGIDPLIARLTDKAWSKQVAASRSDRATIVPTLWSGTDLPEDPPGRFPLIVKSNHGCKQFIVVRSASDWERARVLAPRWLRRSYGEWLDEHFYRAARRMILVEPFLGGEGAPLPEDFKVYVFGGCAEIVQHHVGRGEDHHWSQYDRQWRRVGGHRELSPPPSELDTMLTAAEEIAGAADFLRVDFYAVDGRLWFGEFCLCPGSGLDPFDPIELDAELGRRWSQARRD